MCEFLRFFFREFCLFTRIGSVEVCFLKNAGYDVTSKTDDVITPAKMLGSV